MPITSAAQAKAEAIRRSKRFAKNNPGTKELRDFIKSFEGKFPQELRKELRPLLRSRGQSALSRAKNNASWSRRIPGSLRLSVTFSKRSAGVTLMSNRTRAPHGRAYAGQGQNRTFRAPTGTPPEPWVAHRTRPWFFDVADKELTKDVDRGIGEVVDQVARRHGFR
jgi:hypothetical protein